MKPVGIIDTTVRDGQQSLWATRMTRSMMAPMLPVMDQAGFEAIECMGTAVMDSCVRYLNENPWDRIRWLKSQLRETPMQMITICMGFSVGIGATPDDVMDLFFRRLSANGIDRFFFMDGLNDIRMFEVPIRAAKAGGSKVLGGIVYSISPVHTDEHFVQKTRELVQMGADIIVLKDPNGILTPERVRTLVPAMQAVCGDLPLYCHSHCITGLGPATNLEAVKQGVSGIWTCASPLANGSSLPATESMLRHLERAGYHTGVDKDAVNQMADHFRKVAIRHDLPLGKVAEYDPSFYEHQMPGGMISNFRAQLEAAGIGHRLDEVLDEIPAVRADLGWALMVTPFSQVIGTQAAMNVLYGRYNVLLDEVKRLLLGYYGKTPGPVNENLRDKAAEATGLKLIEVRPGALLPPALDRVRAEQGPFASDEEMLLSYFFMPDQLKKIQDAGSIQLNDETSSLVDLVRDVAAREDIKRFHLVM